MLSITLLWILFLGSISYNSFPFSLNDIFMLLSIFYIFLDFLLFNRSVFNSIYSKFISIYLKIFIGLFVGLSVLRFLLSDQNIFYEIIRLIRANYLVFSLFSTLFVLDKSFKFSNKNFNNFGKLLFSILLSISVLVAFSFAFSFFLGCENSYTAKYCIAGQDSYSANGYIAASILLLNFNILFIRNRLSLEMPYKKLSIYLLSPLNIIYSFLVVRSSGSRGAIIALVGALAIFLFYFFVTRIRLLKINKFFIWIFTLTPLFLASAMGPKFLNSRSFALFRFLLSGNFADNLYTKRFQNNVFYKENPFWGSGNFQINPDPLGSSYYDGTFTFFAHSYGWIGIFLIIILILGLINHYIKFNQFIEAKKLYNLKDLNSILISTITFYLIASFPNELIILNNGVSMVFMMTLVFTLYAPYFYLQRYF